MAPVDEALAQVSTLSAELNKRRPDITANLDAYRGKHKLRFASPEFSAYFAERFEGFSDNWCNPVIQATTERMNVLGIELGGARRADEDLSRVWKVNGCEAASSKAWVVGLAASRTFALVWGNTADETTPRVTWEHPENCVVGYDPDTGEAVAALKFWSGDGIEYATLYQRDLVWKFQRRSTSDTAAIWLPPRSAYSGGWEPRQPAGDDVWPLPNPMGEVPVVEFRNQDLLDDKPISDIAGVAAMQAAINLVWAYLLNGLDYATLPQRVVTGADMPKVPILDEQGKVIGSRPLDLNLLAHERVLWIPSKDAKASEWSAANLQAFDVTLDRAVNHVSAQTRTPPHYLVGKMANLSADALTAAETGQVAKAGERVTYFTPSMRQLNRLIALAQGDRTKADACRSGTVRWKDIQFRSLAQKADAFQKLKEIGFPFEWIAEQWGLGPDDVTRVLAMRKREQAEDPIGALTLAAGRGLPDDPAGGDPGSEE
ncbi:phage portal protein [Actinoplanes rectilineatus]|uniref:phage portal protein n=1 Tax=Actinoplanes rectilineatus TaxID=113571 RepID=UPI0005F2F761|nr:phage portal protein [Actinoplanes rectilineatus]